MLLLMHIKTKMIQRHLCCDEWLQDYYNRGFYVHDNTNKYALRNRHQDRCRAWQRQWKSHLSDRR